MNTNYHPNKDSLDDFNDPNINTKTPSARKSARVHIKPDHMGNSDDTETIIDSWDDELLLPK